MGLSWHAALAAVFLSSVIFFIITVVGLREAILNAIPKDLKLAIGSGIGFFLAFLGLANAGIIVSDPSTIVDLTGEQVKIVREGPISLKDIEKVL